MGFRRSFGALLIPYLVGADEVCSDTPTTDDEGFSTLQVRQEHAQDAAKVCCLSMSASCRSCQQGVHIEDWCRKHPDTDGCHSQYCDAPAEKFNLPHKSCPSPHDKSTCVAHNIYYHTFDDAWAACGAHPECGIVMRYKNDRYYLRRLHDPDEVVKYAASMLYECPAVCPLEEPDSHHCSHPGLECDYHPVVCGDDTIFATTAQCSDQGVWSLLERFIRCPGPKPCHSSPPPEHFNLKSKSCPNDWGKHSTCLAHNRKYHTFHEAWAACGVNPECGVVTKWKDGEYFLRRTSDPDHHHGGEGSIHYGCDVCPDHIPNEHEECHHEGLQCDFDPQPCNGLAGGHFHAHGWCGAQGWEVIESVCPPIMGELLPIEPPIEHPVGKKLPVEPAYPGAVRTLGVVLPASLAEQGPVSVHD